MSIITATDRVDEKACFFSKLSQGINKKLARREAPTTWAGVKGRRQESRTVEKDKLFMYNQGMGAIALANILYIGRARARSRWGLTNDHRKVKKSSQTNKIFIHNSIGGRLQ